MEPGDSLVTIAEISLGLAGSTAVVAAFMRPAGLAPLLGNARYVE